MEKQTRSKLCMAGAMAIFGTIGIFRKFIPLPSSMLACVRGIIGTLFLLTFLKVTGRKMNRESVRKNAKVLVILGAMIGINWILLFESYKYTSVALATLCYYLSPTFVILASPIVLKEKLTPKKLVCALIAFAGMAVASGVFGGSIEAGEIKGIILGVLSAMFYAAVVLVNRKVSDIDAFDKTIIQLASAAAVALPYVLITEDLTSIKIDAFGLVMTLVVGIVHTGIAYVLYFGSLGNISAQTTALLAYIDPVLAIILSALILHEEIGLFGVIGAVMVLGATAYGELSNK